jgi:soluble lytic murein transglycosylase-like protein
MEPEEFWSKLIGGLLLFAAAVALVVVYGKLGQPAAAPVVPWAPALIEPPRSPAAALEARRSKLILRAEIEAKSLVPTKNVIATRRAAFRIEDGILIAKSQTDLDQWEDSLNDFMRSQGASAPLTTPLTELVRLVDKQGRALGLYELLHGCGVRDPRALVLSVVETESAFDSEAVSRTGAVGLMQVMPNTAADYGVKNGLREPENNVRVGMLYLRDALRAFGRLDQALAAYNAGIQRIRSSLDKNGKLPAIPENQEYVRRVLQSYERRLLQKS